MSVFETVVPLFISGLRTYDHILAQAEAHAQATGVDVDAAFFDARLVADQLPLSFQVQNTTSLAQINVARLVGEAQAAPAPLAKGEKTVAELRQRVQRTLAALEGVDASRAVGKEDGEVELPALGTVHKTSAKVAVLSHGLPNFFFHLNTGYSILRAKGVPLGKKDYLSSFLPFN